MARSITPVDAAGIDNIAEGLLAFVDEMQEPEQSMLTSFLFQVRVIPVTAVALTCSWTMAQGGWCLHQDAGISEL